MIEPTLGRVVHYHPKDEPGERHAAMIAKVNADGTVNLGCLTDNGVHYSAQNVTLVQDGEPNTGQCEWMAYQKGQAAKTEELVTSEVYERYLASREQKKLLDNDIAVGPQVFVSPVEKMIGEAALMGTAALHVSETGAEVVTLSDMTDEVVTGDDLVTDPPLDGEGDDLVIGAEPGDPDFIGPMEPDEAVKAPKSKAKSH